MDTVGFLMEQPSLQARPLLYRLFTISCLCLDGLFQTLLVVKFNSIKTDDRSSRLADITLPMQSYFKNVPLGIDTLSSNASITKFLSLEATFGVGALNDLYDPFQAID